MNEEFTNSVNSTSVNIYLMLAMQRTSDDQSFDYSISVDDVGQIQFTPNDPEVCFTSINRLAGYDDVTDITEKNTRKFSVSLTADMISDSNNFDWFLDIDEVGSAVITPDAEDSSFISVAVNDSLNLITEALDEDQATKAEICINVLTDMAEATNKSVENCNAIERHMRDLKMDTNLIRSMATAYNKLIEEANEVLEQFNELSQPEEQPVEEALTEATKAEDHSELITRFLRGDMQTFTEENKDPDANLTHIRELDTFGKWHTYRYFYDKESDSMIVYHDVAVDSHVE